MRWAVKEEAGLAALSIVTFLILLPVLCSTWRYSLYYRGGSNESPTTEDDSSVLSYLARVTAAAAVDNQSDNDPAQPPLPSYNWRVSLLVTIVTVRREGHFYLSRVVGRLHQLLSRDADKQLNDAIQVLICNVDHMPELHQEAIDLGRIYPVVQRNSNSSSAGGQQQQKQQFANLMDKEKEDYAFCLNASRHRPFVTDYILMLEDDALPLDDLFAVTRRVTNYLYIRRPDFFYVKLYHPERLQGYWQPEPWRIAEWLALSVLSVSLLTLRYQLRRPLLWVIYFMALAECVGRPHLLQLRRWLGPAAYNVLAATECCTPAMLFTDASAYIAAEHLSSITCRRGYAKDIALYHYARQSKGRLEAFVVEPNLVQHIGRVSTLRFWNPNRALALNK